MHLEQYESQTTWRSSMLMFVAGTAIGAVAALMMAPSSGREARDYLRRQSRKMANDMGTQADRLASAVKWGREQATSAVESAVSQAKSAYNTARSRTDEVTEGMSHSQPVTQTSTQTTPRSPRSTSSPS